MKLETKLKMLTSVQRDQFVRLQKEGEVLVACSRMRRAYKKLVDLGFAYRPHAKRQYVFALVKDWDRDAKVIPAAEPIPKPPLIPLPAPKKVGRPPTEDLPPPIPDPPKKPFKRHPAVYSNPNWNDLIDKILKSK